MIRLAQPPFFSPQGEGDFTGMPSVWLRFFGCNLRCSGFGQDNPTDPTTYKLPQFDREYTSIQDIPVFQYGCDSGYAWHPNFKNTSTQYSLEDIRREVQWLLNQEFGSHLNTWRNRWTGQRAQLCFTGGEPMLQQKAIYNIVRDLVGNDGGPSIPQVTIETNGTQPLKDSFVSRLLDYTGRVHFAISPKLFAVSGEKDAVKEDIIESYVSEAHTACIKFVHNGSQEAWDELEQYEPFLSRLSDSFMFNTYIMPCGGRLEEQEANARKIAEQAIRRGYAISARMHVYLFGNDIDK